MRHQDTKLRRASNFRLESLEQRSLLSGLSPTVATNDTYFLYQNLLHRNPAQADVSFWAGNLERGVSPQAVYNSFVNGTEYKGLVAAGLVTPSTTVTSTNFTTFAAAINTVPIVYGSSLGTSASVKTYVDTLYQTLLGRTADTAGQTFWVNRINAGASLNSVVDGFLNSAEYNSPANAANAYTLGVSTFGGTTETTAFVDSLYSGILFRSPDTAGETYWVSKIQLGQSPNSVVTAFFTSAEYVNGVKTGTITT